MSKDESIPILVIEDQALNRKVVRIVLQSKGYKVIEASDAIEALFCLKTTTPALILMDIALPGTSGEDLTRQLKTDPNWSEIPIIALTAAAMSGDRERLLNAGCDDYLSKPIDTRFLLERVAHHLKGHKNDGEETATILVVDDEPRNVRILQIQLEARGYTVLTAGDGADALEIIADKPPDLILLDINMPKVDGFQVVKRVRADKKTEFIPIIMITALRDTHENRIKAVEAGADDFIEKPFNSFEVMARIKSLLRIKLYHDRLEQHNERLAAELQMARTVQDILIPQNGSQEIAGFNVASHCSPALEIGGDFFDLWEIDENRLGVLISDVMGHGASAALVKVFIKTIVAEHRDKFSDDPAHLLHILNTRFNTIISSHLYMFATAFCGVFDQKQEQLICANAGHPLPFLQHTPQSDCELITHQQTGNGLGISRESVYENCAYPFNALSRTFLYTDGAYEVKNPHGEQFTVEQLQNTIATCDVKTPQDLIQQVSDTINDFRNGHPNEDDVTIIAIQG